MLLELFLISFGAFINQDQLDNTVNNFGGFGKVDSFDDTIGGESANCYRSTFDVDDNDGESTICFADNGLLLLQAFSGVSDGEEANFRIEATSVDTNVSDSDFEPPYDVEDLGDLGDLGDLFD